MAGKTNPNKAVFLNIFQMKYPHSLGPTDTSFYLEYNNS